MFDRATGMPAEVAEAVAQFEIKHRRMRRQWELPGNFPSRAVQDAYSNARVDSSLSRFTFGRPNGDLIQEFCSEKFGWPGQRVHDILQPILKARDACQLRVILPFHYQLLIDWGTFHVSTKTLAFLRRRWMIASRKDP